MKKYIKLLFIMIFVLLINTACGKDDINYLVLVNKQNKLPDDWEGKVTLVDAKNAWNDDIKIEKETYEKYLELKKDLENEGVYVELDSVYRSVKDQQTLWDNWTEEKGIDYVRKYVSVPGYSEHHTGLAVDICIKKDGELVYKNDDMISEREIFSKIHAKLAKYGFILRYLEGKDEITGYSYEPWHLRYIGDSEVAKKIMDENLTLEQYLGIDYSKYMGYQFSGKDPWDNELAVTIRTISAGKMDWTFTDLYNLGENSITLYNELSTSFDGGKSSFKLSDNIGDNIYSFNYEGKIELKDDKVYITYEKGELTSNSSNSGSTSHHVEALDKDKKIVVLTKIVDNN